ncbi:MAG: hypothetical protein NW216_02040 [Hyphomicrobium sp.]|nr:hypothetical protein [Hyphomicrobium sp.]
MTSDEAGGHGDDGQVRVDDIIRADTSRGLIEIRLHRLEQLFNSLDPSPFHERDLDDDAEDFIVSWARELPADRSIRIVMHLPEEEVLKAKARGAAAAMCNYFHGRAKRLALDHKELIRMGWRYLVVGVPILAACLVGSHVMPQMLGEGAVARTLGESLVILGWVANWKPLEVFLYDWWPIRRRMHLYERLSRAEIDFNAL